MRKKSSSPDAPFGIVGLETELGLFQKLLIDRGVLDWPAMLAKLTTNPAKLLGLDRGTLAPGAPGDVTIIDPKHAWKVDSAKFESPQPQHALRWVGIAPAEPRTPS